MKFSIGDIVLLKRTGEEGVVTGFVSDELIEVMVDGTHFPVYADELDHPYLKWFTEQRKKKRTEEIKKQPPLDKKNKQPDIVTGFHLSFLPVYRFDDFEDVVDKFKTFFINQTPHKLTLQYECSGRTGSLFQHTAQIQPFSNFYLHDIGFDDMQDQPRFSWIVAQDLDPSKVSSLSDTLRMKRKKLFEYISLTQQRNDPMFHIQLAKDFPDTIAKQTENLLEVDLSSLLVGLSEQLNKKRKPKPIPEIDLHIEQLINNKQGLSNFEMLSLQLEAFSTALDTAIAAGQHSMIVIHGVGSGRLKDEIHQLLQASNAVDYYQNEWSPRYGYGATQIFFNF